jgi:hypothetical protein
MEGADFTEAKTSTSVSDEAIQRREGLGVSPLAAVIADRHEKALRRMPEGAF